MPKSAGVKREGLRMGHKNAGIAPGRSLRNGMFDRVCIVFFGIWRASETLQQQSAHNRIRILEDGSLVPQSPPAAFAHE